MHRVSVMLFADIPAEFLMDLPYCKKLTSMNIGAFLFALNDEFVKILLLVKN